jgi:hypothetical protein
MHHDSRQADDLVDWFAGRLPIELRGRLMTERPLEYEALFPGVSHQAILDHVEAGLKAQARERMIKTGKPVAEALLDAVRSTDHPWNGGDTVEAVSDFISSFGVTVPNDNEGPEE